MKEIKLPMFLIGFAVGLPGGYLAGKLMNPEQKRPKDWQIELMKQKEVKEINDRTGS